MGIKEDFDLAMDEWTTHSSQPKVALVGSGMSTDCDGFRRIVAIGRPALPFIRDQLRNNPPHLPYGSLVKQILGDEISFPPEIHGRANAIRAHILAWLDANLPAD